MDLTSQIRRLKATCFKLYVISIVMKGMEKVGKRGEEEKVGSKKEKKREEMEGRD